MLNYRKKLGVMLKPIQDAIMREILDHANKNGISRISQDKIASRLGVSTRTIIRHLQEIEKVTINGLPFMIRGRSRAEGGTWEHTVYFFPWITREKTYLLANNKEIIEKLELEFTEEYYREIDHVTKSHSISNRQNNYICLRELIHNLMTTLGMKAVEVLKVLSRIGHEVKNGTYIYHLDKYLLKAFIDGEKQMKAEEKLQAIYTALYGDNDFFYINMEGYADAILGR